MLCNNIVSVSQVFIHSQKSPHTIMIIWYSCTACRRKESVVGNKYRVPLCFLPWDNDSEFACDYGSN